MSCEAATICVDVHPSYPNENSPMLIIIMDKPESMNEWNSNNR